MNIVEELITALRSKDASRSRSNQTQIGPSELGSCRRKVWYRLNSQPTTNDDSLKLAAIMGTAIHTEIEAALRSQDPDSTRFWLETEVEYEGMKAHIDCYIPEEAMIVDWKTIKSKTASYFPSEQQKWQVQVYGYLMKNGNKQPVEKVALVAICRDGDERDVLFYEEPYDEAKALKALQWLEELKTLTAAPEPEKDSATYCQHYCQYFDATGEMGCAGRKKAPVAGLPRIGEISVSNAASKYFALNKEIKVLTDEKDSLRVHLEGNSGITDDGISVIWSAVAPRKLVDSAEVEKALGYIPYKLGNETYRLEVKRMNDEGGESNGSE